MSMNAADESAVVFELDEVFDVPAALRLRDWLRALPSHTDVTLDCRRTRHFDGFAFAALTQLLTTAHGGRFATRGLTQSHRRVLQYLGFAEAAQAGVPH